MGLLRGAFRRKLDSRGRILLPMRFRDALGTAPLAVVSGQRCFEVVAASHLGDFREELVGSETDVAEEVHGGSPKQERATTEGALSVIGLTHVDRAGRITLPKLSVAALRAHGNEVVLFGCSRSFQVWDPVYFEDDLRREPCWNDEDEALLRRLGK